MPMTSFSDTGPHEETHDEHVADTTAQVPPPSPTVPADPDPGAAEQREALIQTHLGLARAIAWRYTNRGVEREDLHQVASLALVLAASRFDTDRGSSFPAYASVSIHGELKRHLRDHAWAVRPPRSLHDTYQAVRHATHDLTQALGAAPTTGDIAEYLQISVDQVRGAHQAASAYTATSLEALIEERPGESENHFTPATVGAFDTIDLVITMDQIVSRLPARDQQIVRMRFHQDLSQQQIGHRLGLSQMHVSRLLTSITTRLREQFPHVA